VTSADQYSAALASWTQDSPVPVQAGEQRLTLTLESLAGLGLVRRQVRAFLVSGLDDGTGDAGQEAVGDAVMVIDELTSNALRHGSAPSRLLIRDEQAAWTVVVVDAAPGRLPTPAQGRVEGEGGYGLYMVSDLTESHGVHYEADRKLVWARLTKPAGSS
jgi:anti-sigma regulatory factor (Ser/Thr protein kinase)